jgi:glucuronokinase
LIIETKAFARAGLIGNPSDGYHGKTISIILRNFRCRVILWESPELEILPAARDHSRFQDISALVGDVQQYGYYGGVRLVMAAIKKFHDHMVTEGIELPKRNFTLRYDTDIPQQVGLGGSSAIITAILRALMMFYGVQIPQPVLPNIVLATEVEELGISAGLQDRVIQVYEGMVFMDFDRDYMAKQGHGRYENLDPDLLPPLYLAYRTGASQGSEVFHNSIRYRYEQEDPEILKAMSFLAGITDQARDALESGRPELLAGLMDSNFDCRNSIYHISDLNREMVAVARNTGASAKFAGSGGCIIGVYKDKEMYNRLEESLGALDVQVFKPEIKDDRE